MVERGRRQVDRVLRAAVERHDAVVFDHVQALLQAVTFATYGFYRYVDALSIGDLFDFSTDIRLVDVEGVLGTQFPGDLKLTRIAVDGDHL